MPGIESFGRENPQPPESVETTPEKLAHLLFVTLVLDEEPTFMESIIEHLRSVQGFQQKAFERQQFIYLVSNIALALAYFFREVPEVGEVIPFFRLMVLAVAHDRWLALESAVYGEIEEASSDYAKLVFKNPDEDRGLSFDWAKEWLGRIGVEEFNPIVLFRISHRWKSHHLHTAELLRRFRVTVKPFEGEAP